MLTDSKNDKITMKDELLSHIHEQYAVNNNANLSSMVTLIIGVIAVIGYYGYVFIETENVWGSETWFYKHYDSYTMITLLLTYFASVCILAILTILCIYQGTAQRKEQFIIDAIRHHYEEEKGEIRTQILKNSYSPFGKKKLEIIQGLFGEFVKIFLVFFIILTIATLLRVIESLTPLVNLESVIWSNVIVSIIIVLVTITIVWGCIYYFNYMIKEYEKIAEKFENNNTEKKEQQ